jgi:hypothetical protein
MARTDRLLKRLKACRLDGTYEAACEEQRCEKWR